MYSDRRNAAAKTEKNSKEHNRSPSKVVIFSNSLPACDFSAKTDTKTKKTNTRKSCVTRSMLGAGTETTSDDGKMNTNIFVCRMIKQYFVFDVGDVVFVCVRVPCAGWHLNEVVTVCDGRRRKISQNLFCRIQETLACHKLWYYRPVNFGNEKREFFFSPSLFAPLPPESDDRWLQRHSDRWPLGQNRRSKMPAAAGDVPTSKQSCTGKQ